MLFDVEERIRRQAKSPHELFMLNLAVFHLLMAPAAIVFGIGVWGFLVPLSLSLAVIGLTHIRSHRAENHAPWFVAAHWKLAVRRYRILLIVYAIGAIILGVGFLIAQGSSDKNMSDIILTISFRIAVVPLLVAVMVCFVLESGSIYQAGRAEVPDALVKYFPPPKATGRN